MYFFKKVYYTHHKKFDMCVVNFFKKIEKIVNFSKNGSNLIKVVK
jgi:hypothetical protein